MKNNSISIITLIIGVVSSILWIINDEFLIYYVYINKPKLLGIISGRLIAIYV